MDFFGRQDDARTKSRALTWLFVAAVFGTVAGVNVIVALSFGLFAKGHDDRIHQGLIHALTTVATLAIIGLGSAWQWFWLRGGGATVAESLGGQLVEAENPDPLAKRLRNVVEEMSIASGVPMPAVYIMPGEDGINAFAAGWHGNDAAVAVTRGALERLTRDELQGVIAHEFSHILNGDARLNLRLIGLVFGLELIGSTGRILLNSGSMSSSSRERKNNGAQIALLGLGLLIVGYLGWFAGRLIKAAINRTRESLADASAVQFTRNPEGLANALKKVGADAQLGVMKHANAEMAGHLYIVNGLQSSWTNLLSTHPPIGERISALDPRWDGTWSIAQRQAAVSPPPQPQESVNPSRARLAAPLALGVAGASRPPGDVRARNFIDRVGTQPSAAASVLWVDSIDGELRSACDDPFSARAIILAACADPEPARAAQAFSVLDKRLDQSVGERQLLREIRALHPLIHRLGPAAPSTVIMRCGAALRRLVPAQRLALRRWIELLIYADQVLTLREVALATMANALLGRHADDQRSASADDTAAATILGALAHLDDDAAAAFAKGWKAFSASERDLPPRATVVPVSVARAIERMAVSSFADRGRLLTAAALCASNDGMLTPDEGELLRALALAMDLPMPPLIAPSAVSA